MAAHKKDALAGQTAQVVGDPAAQIEERRKRREEAVTVDGSETPSSKTAGAAFDEDASA
jgi:hypothetical protein